MQIKQILLESAARLRALDFPMPVRDAEYLLAHALKKDRQYLLMNPTQVVSTREFLALLNRRLRGEPLEYVLGYAEFCGHRFWVSPSVLIPRPETEFLVQEVLAVADKTLRVCDVGTGSGAIAVSVKLTRPEWEVYASDLSREALMVATRNSADLGAGVFFRQSDLLKDLDEKFDLIVANLPYLPHTVTAVQPSVWANEPHLALFSGEDGLDLYRTFLAEIAETQKQLRYLFCEIGHDQGPAFLTLAKKFLPNCSTELKKDLAGFDRIIKIELNNDIS